jgi:hypothetical protein
VEFLFALSAYSVLLPAMPGLRSKTRDYFRQHPHRIDCCPTRRIIAIISKSVFLLLFFYLDIRNRRQQQLSEQTILFPVPALSDLLLLAWIYQSKLFIIFDFNRMS